MSRYIPPALRKTDVSGNGVGNVKSDNDTPRADSPEPEPGRWSAIEIHKHFWPEWDPYLLPLDCNNQKAHITEQNNVCKLAWAAHIPGTSDAIVEAESTKDKEPTRTQQETETRVSKETIDSNGGFVRHQHFTLNTSAASKDALAYIMIWHGSNPRWEADGIIFVHTSLYVLPDISKDVRDAWYRATSTQEGLLPDFPEQPDLSEDNLTQNVAVFGQPDFKRTSKAATGRAFEFLGYHKVTHVERLAPRSASLARMLEQKWACKRGARKRTAREWERSMSMEWAVLKLEIDEASKHPAPAIKHLTVPPEYKDYQRGAERAKTSKSVNELLTEMRLQDCATVADEKH